MSTWARSHRPEHRRPSEQGQAAVELALSLPLVVFWLLALAQFVVLARGQIAVVHAAREGARAAAIAASPTGAAERAARDAIALRPLVVSSSTGQRVSVTVRYDDPTDVPLVGAVLPTVTLRATAHMQREP